MTHGPQSQLIFASFDSDGRLGGWQVKAESVAESADRDLLMAGVRPQLPAGHEPPKFPTPNELEALPRRLVHRSLPGGRSGLWHTSPAGRDASGRPGNAVVHAILLNADESRSHRAADLWRSRAWVRPFGPEQVRDAQLPPPDRWKSEPGERPTPVADPASVAELLFPPHPQAIRTGLLDRLLDLLDRRQKVTLLIDSPEEAAQWIGAVSAFTSAALALRLSWSTWESAADLANPQVRDLTLVGVPRAEAASMEQDSQRVVVDVLDTRTGGGDESDRSHAEGVHPWAWLVRQVYEGGRQDVEDVVERLRASRVGTWKTAGFRDALAWDTKKPPADDPNSRCIAALEEALVDPHLVPSYIDAVVANEEWLSGDGPPQVVRLLTDTDLRLVANVEGRLERLTWSANRTNGRARNAWLILRILDFAWASGLSVHSEAAEETLVDVLCGSDGPSVADRHGPVNSADLRGILADRAQACGVSADQVRDWLGITSSAHAVAGEQAEEDADVARGEPAHEVGESRVSLAKPFARIAESPRVRPDAMRDAVAEAAEQLAIESEDWDIVGSEVDGVSAAHTRADAVLKKHQIDSVAVLSKRDASNDGHAKSVAILALHRSGGLPADRWNAESAAELIAAATHLIDSSSDQASPILGKHSLAIIVAAALVDRSGTTPRVETAKAVRWVLEHFPQARDRVDEAMRLVPGEDLLRETPTYRLVQQSRARRRGLRWPRREGTA